MNKETLNKIIRNRKTIYPRQFSDKEIPESVINEILENAIHAPTHRMTQPWFFKVYKGKSKDVLCEIIYKIDKDKYSLVKINKFVEKVKSSDTVISVCMTRDENDRVPEWEEVAAVSMAVQNMWLSCYANNIGSYWSTPALNIQVWTRTRNHLASFLWVAMSMLRFQNLEMDLIVKLYGYEKSISYIFFICSV